MAVRGCRGPGHAAAVAEARVAEQHGRPDLGVEDDVVLAHEVVSLGAAAVSGALPERAPRIGVAGASGPLDGRRQVADHGVEPDVEPLVVTVAPPVERYRYAPVEVAADRARLEVVEHVHDELAHVRPPVLLRLEPVAERAGERRQVEEVVLGLDELRRLAVDQRARVDQVDRVELVAAVVALVATRMRVAADRAGALDVAVRQRAARRRADRAQLRLREDVAVLQQRQEDLLRHRVVVLRGGAGEQVIGEAQSLQVLRR